MPKLYTPKVYQQAWVVAVDMGYGHQRAAYPLRHLSPGRKIVTANAYPGIPQSDRKLWHDSRRFYEFVSRFKKVPLIGQELYDLYDKLQEIPKFYPRRDLSVPSLQVKLINRLITQRQWGKHLMNKLAKKPLPLLTTFFVPAFMAEAFDYPGEIYCLATDADISRAWVSIKPSQSRIKYFAPTFRVAERLQLYGVPKQNILTTGFPLPEENTDGLALQPLKQDLIARLVNLDPARSYQQNYAKLLHRNFGLKRLPRKSNHPLTITFAVGGAGAQEGIGITLLQSLRPLIQKGELRLNLVAGIHNSVSQHFRAAAIHCGLRKHLGKQVRILFANDKMSYFRKFNLALRTTDILWTKPSELSFYCALGLPIVMSPPIGSQELFNRRWLTTMGAGVDQEDPQYAYEWLPDWLASGWLAEAAMQGFVEAPKFGTAHIRKVIAHQTWPRGDMSRILQF